jgi:transposase InsO family protein
MKRGIRQPLTLLIFTRGGFGYFADRTVQPLCVAVGRYLHEDGERVSEKRVARLMRANGLRGWIKKRFKLTTVRDEADPVAPNVLARDFTAAAPNQHETDTSEKPPKWIFAQD